MAKYQYVAKTTKRNRSLLISVPPDAIRALGLTVHQVCKVTIEPIELNKEEDE